MSAKKIAAPKLHENNPALSGILDSLKKVGLLSDIKENELALTALTKLITETHFKPGHNIIIEGAEGAEMFILIEGTAAVIKSTPGGEPYKVAILNSDYCPAFGEGGLIGSEKRGATIRAEVACHCLQIARQDFENFATDYPAWALPIYRRIAQSVMLRLRQTNEDMLLLYNALVAEIRGS